MVLNALSVDVEDWFQVGAFETVIDRNDWETLDQRVDRNTNIVLDMFAARNVKGTFFTLGWIAKRNPGLIRRMIEQGHEVASHGWDHQRVFQIGADRFKDDIAKTKALLEDQSGKPVTGYRAPSFSIDARTPWAHELLAETGHLYSSSVAPVVHDHYGWPEAPRFAYKPVLGSPLIELPVTTARVAGRTIAAGGGGFFRVLPYAFSRWAVRQANKNGEAAIIYFHPWEIDPLQPRVAGAPLKSTLRHYTNLDVMAGKLERLINDFAWGRVDAIADAKRALLP